MDLAFDRQHIWHPYTSTLTPLTCYPVVGAEGVLLEMEDGKRVIDGMSSWWSTIHGYNQNLWKAKFLGFDCSEDTRKSI